jgi:outer membrane receptor protein involved in Fe transport
VPFDVNYRSRFDIYSVELNQIFQREHHTDIFGARFQKGNFDAHARLDNPPPPFSTNGTFALPEISTTDADLQRLSIYAYHHWEVVDRLLLIGGLTYDDVRFPANYRRPPLNADESTRAQVSPKAGLVWDLTPRLRARAVYAQAVGGVSYDESVRLEPTQLAGYSQAFRSLISESLVGSVEAPRYEIIGGAFDLRPWTNAWVSLQGEVLRERVDREIGIFNFTFGGTPPASPATANEQLDYHEFNGRILFNQIVARDWFLEAEYQFSRSELERTLPDIAATATYARTTRTEADLHRFKMAATWRHPSGFFARGEFWWFIQDLSGSQPGDSFPQLNLYAGYNFWRRRADITLGLLNATGDDYRLSPLNYYAELPRERVFYTRLRFNF